MQPFLSWRTAGPGDLPACLAVRPAKNGEDTVGRGHAQMAWEQMFQKTYAARGAVVELHFGEKTEIVGFGFGIFVRSEIIEAELSDPKPGLNARMVEGVLSGRDPICSFAEVRSSNTKGNLQQIIMHASWKDEALTATQRDEVRVLLGVAYSQRFAGYRMSRVLTEIVDALDEWHVKGHRSFSILDRFEKFHENRPESSWSRERALAMASRASVQSDPGSIAAGLFQHNHIPRFGFTRGEQELLEVALDGLDDPSASRALFVTRPAIKRRWENIFDRVGVSMPDLCPSDGSPTRGIQKRNRILAYLRHHPEELRPFDAAMERANMSSSTIDGRQ